MAVPKRGEVWWVNQNPIIPNDPHLPRPVIIVSTNPRNRHWNSVIVVPLSTGLTNLYPAIHKFLPRGSGGLPQDSYARCDLVSNIAKSCLDPSGPIGPILADKFLWEIVRGVRAAIGDTPDI
ncbi:MAG: type II toxin-antitoxin system PemK/MazF family toxin [Candidatus Melainabacteria bacterium]|nr:type II toxin-antitoxin system PemK/MazF family toxin [Candidatus Melainabacteria bacterium]